LERHLARLVQADGVIRAESHLSTLAVDLVAKYSLRWRSTEIKPAAVV
jgi:hypothetical protein